MVKDAQGSGKAVFPGEKLITNESPRMEEEDDIDFDEIMSISENEQDSSQSNESPPQYDIQYNHLGEDDHTLSQ